MNDTAAYRALANELPRWKARNGDDEDDQLAAIYLRQAADEIDRLRAEVARMQADLQRAHGALIDKALANLRELGQPVWTILPTGEVVDVKASGPALPPPGVGVDP